MLHRQQSGKKKGGVKGRVLSIGTHRCAVSDVALCISLPTAVKVQVWLVQRQQLSRVVQPWSDALDTMHLHITLSNDVVPPNPNPNHKPSETTKKRMKIILRVMITMAMMATITTTTVFWVSTKRKEALL